MLGNPANRNRAVPLTYDQFRYAFANAVSEEEAKELYETFAFPASGVPPFQAATANLNPWTEAKVDTKNPDRGPLPIISGEGDLEPPFLRDAPAPEGVDGGRGRDASITGPPGRHRVGGEAPLADVPTCSAVEIVA